MGNQPLLRSPTQVLYSLALSLLPAVRVSRRYNTYRFLGLQNRLNPSLFGGNAAALYGSNMFTSHLLSGGKALGGGPRGN